MLNVNKVQFKQIPAFQDNYIWMICQSGRAWVVDPGDSGVVIERLQADQLSLAGILVTHHHNDHIGGIEALRQWAEQQAGSLQIKVIGPLGETIPFCDHAVIEGDEIELFHDVKLQVLEVPGHTKGHIAYYLPKTELNQVSRVFCGDTLFASGCGRLFEGTPAQMTQSLAKLAQLPADTLACCAHEYTLSNIRFALAVEPDNADLKAWAQQAENLRQAHEFTVPTTLAHELRVNPFLRCQNQQVIDAASTFANRPLTNSVEVFAALRSWKDIFK